MINTKLKAPFPWFGGKSTIAHRVWRYLGDVKSYFEPFFGSGAVLLNRPPTRHEKIYEVVCDLDGTLCNAWRSIKFKPQETAEWCSWPVNHIDLAARRRVLQREQAELVRQLVEDDMFCNPKLAGYWIWGVSCWIGGGFMTDKIYNVAGQRPHLIDDIGVSNQPLLDWFGALACRLRGVKVVCGDWTRVCGGNWQHKNKPVGMFFDPPYATDTRDTRIYQHDSLEIGKAVEAWARERGKHPDYRIVVCGYNDEYQLLLADGWRVEAWKTGGSYSNQGKTDNPNRHRERLFISPHCPQNTQPELWKEGASCPVTQSCSRT